MDAAQIVKKIKELGFNPLTETAYVRKWGEYPEYVHLGDDYLVYEKETDSAWEESIYVECSCLKDLVETIESYSA